MLIVINGILHRLRSVSDIVRNMNSFLEVLDIEPNIDHLSLFACFVSVSNEKRASDPVDKTFRKSIVLFNYVIRHISLAGLSLTVQIESRVAEERIMNFLVFLFFINFDGDCSLLQIHSNNSGLYSEEISIQAESCFMWLEHVHHVL